MIKYNGKNIQLAKNNRKAPTEAEKLFWNRVRRKQIKGYQFYRQRPLGEYIVDFYCPAANLVVEIDGGGHYSPEQMKKDAVRDEYLSQTGLKVLGFSNTDVMTNTDGVMESLHEILD